MKWKRNQALYFHYLEGSGILYGEGEQRLKCVEPRAQPHFVSAASAPARQRAEDRQDARVFESLQVTPQKYDNYSSQS